jgi:hypothetical protein
MSTTPTVMASASSSNDADERKVTTMLPTPIDLDQAHERFEDYASAALRHTHTTSWMTVLRRSIGHRFIVLGRRIAADPGPALASPRSPTTMRG